MCRKIIILKLLMIFNTLDRKLTERSDLQEAIGHDHDHDLDLEQEAEQAEQASFEAVEQGVEGDADICGHSNEQVLGLVQVKQKDHLE
jgi:hypothetical protein